ncbi:DUF6328 family protein [Streptomyces griseofuscus]|uniref:DUF6328 family protein n=1 Tax=Streptomyces griseofuscus TaxID=146922 RepID=UPI001C0EA226|nr:DUF6328 family protein [Streptomyces griseofuscus]
MQIRHHLQVQRREKARERESLTVAELLQELRAVQTGVQIFFAFLLGLAFSGRFTSLDDFGLGAYVATLVLTVITTALIATPITLHRRMGHSGSNPRIVPIAARMAEIGFTLLALALNGAILLVTTFVLGRTAGICITILTMSVFIGLWLLLPWVLRPGRAAKPSERAPGAGQRVRTSRMP